MVRRFVACALRGLAHTVLVFTVLLLARPGEARAAGPLAEKDVPAPLKPWAAWVLHDKEERVCPVVQNGSATCSWPTRLELVLDDKGGTFRQEWRVDVVRHVPLPGDARRWPDDVRVDGKRAVVVPKDGKPHVELAVGSHRIEGRFVWDSLPESLAVPKETGLLSLTARGKRVGAPVRDESGAVWLQKAGGDAVEGDALEIVVHRRVDDDVPLKLETRITLSVAGKNREIVLGRSLPAGFVPLLLDAPIPTRVEADSRLRVQARAGTHVIVLTARSEGSLTALARPAPEGPWREGDEVWVFEARPELRVVEVEGVPSIDPQQTSLPDAWKKLPAYPMKLGANLRLVEKRRGDADPPPDQLTLDRRLWLDFDGQGMTMADRISGTLSRSTRLEMGQPATLGRVAIRGKDQFITHTGDAKRLGVEIRQGELDVAADSRLVGSASVIPAVGWNHDFAKVSARLFLPPGYRLFHASGVDEVPGTWLRHFTLLEIFLVLVLALATGRLYGVGWGVLALVTLVLIFPEDDAPKWVWAVLLALEALVRVLPAGLVQRILRGARFAVAVGLLLISIPFLVAHVRHGIYPALAHPGDADRLALTEEESLNNKEGGTGTRARGEAAPVAPAAQALTAPSDGPGAPPPEPPPPPAEDKKPAKKAELKQDESLDRADVSNLGKAKSSPTRKDWRSYGGSQQQLNVDVYDPNAMVQTGPGLPSWTWSTLDLRWSGPVEKRQELRLWLVGPAGNLALALLRAALLVALALRLMPFFDALRRASGGGRGPAAPVAAALTVLALLACPAPARAEGAPPKEMLDTLRERLLAPLPCAPTCASSPSMRLEVAGGTLRVKVVVDTGARVGVPLPGGTSQWLPERVDVDGKPASGLLLEGGKLFVALEPGSHDIVLEGPLPDRETVQVPLPLKPKRVVADVKGYKLEGLHEDGLADDNLQLTRVGAAVGPAAALETTALPAYVRVERTLRVGLSWQVETRVVRSSPLGAAVVLEVPTLPGESVTTADVRVVAGKVLVNLAPQAQETKWNSVLEPKSPLKLTAPKGASWSETWRLDLSPIWHASFDGLPPVHPGAKRFATMPEWRPWPGEVLTLTITRPEGAAGQTITVDDARLDLRPGVRATDATLSLRLRASRGGQHSVTMPPGAVLEALRIGNVAQPIRQEGANVALPITPGAQQVQLVWREPRGFEPRYQASRVDLHLAAVNAQVKVEMGGGRWVLFAAGPRLGPAVLFWSLLLVLLVVAVALSRVRFVPLSLAAWLLLAIGLSQIPVAAGAFVVAWLVALGARKAWPDLSPGWFNLRQVGLVLLTLTALGILVVAVYQGLLGRPDMQIEGNGSSAWQLIWFDDRTDGPLPEPWVVSVPILVYRLAMLAWALWLALSLLKWLRFAWTSFSTGGLWRALPKRPRPVPQWPQHAQPMPPPGWTPQGAYPAPGPAPQAAPGSAPQGEGAPPAPTTPGADVAARGTDGEEPPSGGGAGGGAGP